MEEWKLRLRQARLSKELNKTEFAKLVGVSNPTVTDWEKASEDGGIREITGPKLMRVCEVLGIEPGWLLGKQEKMSSGGLAGSMKAGDEASALVRLLNVYHRADADGKGAIDDVVDLVEAALNKTDSRRRGIGRPA